MSIKIGKIRAAAFCMLGFLALFNGCKKDGESGGNGVLNISGYFPDSGKGRTLVTIQGQGFSPDYDNNIVTFNGVTADVLSVTDDELVVRAPENGTTGDIQVAVNGQQTDVGLFTYQNLSISSVSPLRGASGNVVTIRGYGFGGVTSPPTVTLNDSLAAIVSHTDTLIRVVVPASGFGKGPLKISIGDKQVLGPEFSYFKLLDFSPKFVFKDEAGGQELTLTGNGFDPSITGNRVIFSLNGSDPQFGADTLEIISASEDKIVARVPDGLTGNAWLLLASEGVDGLVSLPDYPQFQLLDKPQISSVSTYGGFLNILGQGLASVDGTARVFIGDDEVPSKYVNVSNVFLIRVTIYQGMGSGVIKVIANGVTAEGGNVTIN